MGAAALAVTALTPACSTGDDEVIVLAAASLTDVMAEFERRFEAANPGVDVTVSTAGTATVRVQIEQGAHADVVAFADTASMTALVEAGVVDDDSVTVFATNRLVLATPLDDPGDVDGLGDLADPERTIGLCATTVPCGSLAEIVLADAGVDAAIDTAESDVRSLLTKIETGELDAGLVYATDADGARVRVVDAGLAPFTTSYTVAPLRDAAGADRANEFVASMLSNDGRALLAEAGFGTP